MRFEVRVTLAALADLEETADWIAQHDDPPRADHVLERIEAAIGALAAFPARGPHPPELLALGIREYRETFFKPYRIIYRIQSRQVHVYLIADGRRDMQTLLARRLLGG